MWTGIKHWILGEEAYRDVEIADQPAQNTVPSTSAAKASAIDEMVELRSGRHASPGSSIAGTPVSVKVTSNKQDKTPDTGSKVKKARSGRGRRSSPVADPHHEDTIVVHSTQETPQPLPDRSRSRGEHSNTVELSADDSITVLQSTYPEGNESSANGMSALDPHSVQLGESLKMGSLPIIDAPKSDSSPAQNKGTKRKRTKEALSSAVRPEPTPKASHKRFASEESETDQPQTEASEIALSVPQNASVVEESDEDDDDDDAPEEVTASVGAQQARSSAARAAQSIKQQEELQRAKRRKRAEEFRTQAEKSRKRKAEMALQPEASATDSLLASTLLGDDDLPHELPDDVLDMESQSQQYSLNAESATTRVNKRKRFDQEARPAKDLVIGNTNVRVLPKSKATLPPAVVRQTAAIKEAWLKARTSESKNRMAGYRVQGAGARGFLRR